MEKINETRLVDKLIGEIRKESCDTWLMDWMQKHVPAAWNCTVADHTACLALAHSRIDGKPVEPAAPANETPSPALSEPAAIDGDIDAQIAAARALACQFQKEITEKAQLIEEEHLAPLVKLLDKIVGGENGPLDNINKLLAKQKKKQLTVTDVAFIAWVHRDSIHSHEDGSSPTWRVVKRAQQHPFVSKMSTNQPGKIFQLLCRIAFCKQIREASVDDKICGAYELVKSPLFDPIFEKIARARL